VQVTPLIISIPQPLTSMHASIMKGTKQSHKSSVKQSSANSSPTPIENIQIAEQKEDLENKELNLALSTTTSTMIPTPIVVATSSPVSSPSTTSIKAKKSIKQKELEILSPTARDIDGMNRAWKAELMRVWKNIANHKYAGPFKLPVNSNEAPDYDIIIKRRMDLSTIKKRLEDGIITTTTEFYRDLLLMFQNALIYNTKDSDVYIMASKLKEFATKEMESVFHTEESLKEPHPKTRRREGPLSSPKAADDDKKSFAANTTTPTPQNQKKDVIIEDKKDVINTPDKDLKTKKLKLKVEKEDEKPQLLIKEINELRITRSGKKR